MIKLAVAIKKPCTIVGLLVLYLFSLLKGNKNAFVGQKSLANTNFNVFYSVLDNF